MKKAKSILAILLSVVIMLSITACGAKKTESEDRMTGDSTVPAVSTQDSTEVEPTVDLSDPNNNPKHPTSKYKPIDMGGRVFKVAFHWDKYYSSSDPEPDPATTSPTDMMIYENLKRVEKKYNMKLQYINIPYDQLGEQLAASVMAGDPVADLMNLPLPVVMSAALNNQIMQVKEYAPENADILNDQYVLYPMKILGEYYVMCERNLPISGRYIGFNQNIFNDLGLETPLQLYQKNEWTWDNFLRLAKAATKDTDGDSVIDQWGFSGFPASLVDLMVAANDGFFLDDANGIHGLDNPKTMEAFEFINKLYNVDKSAFVFNNDIWDWNGNVDYYKEGKSAMFYCETWMFPVGDGRLSYEYHIVPPPKGPSNTGNSLYFVETGGVAMLRGVENPEWAYIIWEEINGWYGDDFSLMESGTREWLESIYLTDEDIDLSIKVSAEGPKIENKNAIPDFPVGNIIGGILIDGKTVAQAVEENKQVAQSLIDAIFKK